MTHDEKLAILVKECGETRERHLALAKLLPDVLNDFLMTNVARFDSYLITKSTDHNLIDRLWNAYMIKQLMS